MEKYKLTTVGALLQALCADLQHPVLPEDSVTYPEETTA